MIRASFKPVLLMFATVALFAGCNHADKKLDEALAKTPPVANTAELQKQAEERIANIPDLTDDQRRQLNDLRKGLKAEMGKLNEEALKLRSLLLEAVLDETYSEGKVSTLKKRMKKVEDEKLATTFKSVDRVNQILGRSSSVERRRAAMYDVILSPSEGIY